MKKTVLLLVVLGGLLPSSCGSTKEKNSHTSLYEGAWELEYLSGIRIAFDGLYPEKKPYLVLHADSQFGGDSSCNIYSGKYTLKDQSIQFGNAIKTMIFCEGGGEEAYLKMLGKVNKLSFDSDGKLLLLQDDVPMMRFKKIAKP